MESGFTQTQFDLLARYGRRPAPDGTQGPIYRALRDAHYATRDWADALCARLFPNGRVEGRRAPINQRGNIQPYTWAKIYPGKGSPHALAYTVGIDADGTFVVKIDTVDAWTSLRANYLAVRGPSNDNSGLASVIDAAEGLTMSREALLSWSAEAIARFSPDYDALVVMLGLEPPLRLETDPSLAWQWGAEWRSVMLDGAVPRGGTFWIPEAEIIADRPKREDHGGYSLSFGVDPLRKVRAVSFVDSQQPGTRNPLSNFATDHRGRRYLLHQARLSSTGANIVEAEFLAASALRPVAVDATGNDANRKWLLVADLDATGDEIRRSTGRFVHCCALVRNSVATAAGGKGAGQPAVAEAPWYIRVAPDEIGGTYVIGARDAVEARVVERKHGLVSMRLREKLGEAIVFRKLQHPLGFEMDGEVLRDCARPLLLEIKTNIGASSIHAGIGQLHLYSRLIPGLQDHDLVLLVPKLPAPEVVEAICAAGIKVHSYSFGAAETGEDIVFSDAFLALCRGTDGT